MEFMPILQTISRDQQNRHTKTSGSVSDKQKSLSMHPKWWSQLATEIDRVADPGRAEIVVMEETKSIVEDKNQHERQSKIGQMRVFACFDWTKFQSQPLFFTEIDKSQLFGLRK